MPASTTIFTAINIKSYTTPRIKTIYQIKLVHNCKEKQVYGGNKMKRNAKERLMQTNRGNMLTNEAII